MHKLGNRQLRLLMQMASPGTLLLSDGKVQRSLAKRGLLKNTRENDTGAWQITADGMRTLADAFERGDLDQFFDKRFKTASQ